MARKKPESAFYSEIRSKLSGAIKSSRIESPMTAAGFPDMILFSNGNAAFIENKAWNGVKRYFPEVRKMQAVFFRDRSKPNVNTNAFIFAKLTGTYCLYHGSTVKQLYSAKRNKQAWVNLADYRWENEMDWDHFLEVINLK